MNHLCGLPNLGEEGDTALLKNLTDKERVVLAALRHRYDSALQHERKNGGAANESADKSNAATRVEEKKDAATEETSLPALPAYLIPRDSLPPSGLRPLDDATLYRYLLADRRPDGALDADLSYLRLLAALKFRREHQCDVIVRNLAAGAIPPCVRRCQRLRVAIWAGTDRASRPVVFERVGQFFEHGGGVDSASREEWTESYLYFLETHFLRMRESAGRLERGGAPVDRIVYLADFKGVLSSILNRKIWKVVPLLKMLVKTVECHYPEIVDHIVLFNVPRVASAVYNFVKGFLDPVTAKKIELFHGVPHKRFKELMSEDVIPTEYGGKNKVDYPQAASK